MLTRAAAGAPAWEIVPITGFSFSPLDPPVRAELAYLAGRSPEQFDVRIDGLKLLEAQRRHPMTISDGRVGFGVGGFATVTTVRATASPPRCWRAGRM